METQIKPLRQRALALTLSLVMLLTLIVPLSVSADHNHDEPIDLDATYGPLIKTAIQGECNYKLAYEVLDKVNAERKKVKKPALEMDKTMLECAMQRASECALRYDHIRPSGESCFTILTNHKGAGENIAAGQLTPAEVMQDWMNSPGHKRNILDENNIGYQSVGIGVFYVNGTYYWCQLFNGLKKQANPPQGKKPVTETHVVEARAGLLDLSINHTSLSLKTGETATLMVKNNNPGFPCYEHLLDPSGLSFVPEQNGVVEISASGVVTPVGDGSTNILVQSKNGITLFTVPVTAENAKLTGSLASNDGKPRIIWNKVTGATSYRVYKCVYQNGKWSESELLKKAKTVLSVTDKNITSGTKVRYKLYAYKGSQRMEGGLTFITTYLDQPTVQVANLPMGVKISWNKVTGASYYKVYRSTYSDSHWSDYTYYKSTKTLEYTDTKVTSGKKVRYTVYAQYGSYQSAYKTGVSTLYLAQPTTKVTNAPKGAAITWTKVTGATSYKIYKSTYKNGKWSEYSYYKASTGTTYTDTKVQSGDKVRYTVYACNGSYKSAEKAGVETTYLSQPTVKLSKATKGVKISWNKVTGATTYKVYKSVYKNGKWSAYTALTTTKSVTYTDTKVKAKEKVRYIVYAYSGNYKSAEMTGVSITR
ncbi:MAG: hypothetical protein E7527_02710 [Ruminococcaceae bacterium]|nr:hypothetical protein [Oscillospiraceae bacterium]